MSELDKHITLENFERLYSEYKPVIHPQQYGRGGHRYRQLPLFLGKQGQAEYYYDYPGIYFRIRETWLS